ncbi:MAG: pyruvate kinase alpha/beta domain-containing protein [Anaerolineae bacterium]|nr:pyruvate kinase alpha/beta domain-containing protein [Anaerolineae bacterium]
MESRILYFESPGKANTEATLRAARQRAEELGIRQVVVASTHGYTAKEALAAFAGLDVRLIAVTICAAFDDQGWTMTAAERSELEALGIEVLTGLHSLGDDVSEAFSKSAPNRVVRETLYCFCQGMKVAVEVAVMAADAGLLDMSQEAIAIAGSSEGADTAIVVKPAYARKFKQFEIREILAKPRSAG